MPRPTSKAALLDASETGLRLLLEEVDAIPAHLQETEIPSAVGDRNVRDVLSHLHEWHELMRGWYEAGMRGEKPAMPAAGYSWKTTPALNARLRQENDTTSLSRARQALLESHRTMMDLISAHTDEELFTKRRYPWTGSTSLGAYLVSATSSHYEWARKKVRALAKQLEASQQLRDS